jgi:hypothetical protein
VQLRAPRYRAAAALTDEGLRVGREWLVGMLSNPRNEYPQFPAALSFIFGLFPDEALAVLERRAVLLGDNLAKLERDLAGDVGRLPPRVTLPETEYLRAVTAAELDWVSGVMADLRTGALSWSQAELAETAKSFLSD